MEAEARANPVNQVNPANSAKPVNNAMNSWEIYNGLRALIDLLIRAHPEGLRVLLGLCPPPGAGELYEIFGTLWGEADADMRVDGGGSALPEAIRLLECAERIDAIVERAGGWEHINRVATEWAQHYQTSWRILVDYVKWVANPFSRIDSSQLKLVAKKHKVSCATVCRRMREFPGEMAKAILAEPLAR